MITSHCLHIHPPRTGGSTIRAALWRMSQIGLCRIVGDFGERSARVADYLTVYKFGFVRNPWAWYLSHYCWHRFRRFDEGATEPSWQFSRSTDDGIIDAKNEADCITFRDWLLRGFGREAARGEEPDFAPLPWRQQPYFSVTRIVRDMLYSADGVLLVNFVGRLERIDDDFQHVLRCSGLPMYTEEIPVVKSTTHKPCCEEYDDEMRELVADRDRWLIEEFGYRFEDA